MLAWLVWITVPLVLGLVDFDTTLFGIFQCCLWAMAFFLFESSRAPHTLWCYTFVMMWILGLVSSVKVFWQFFMLHDMPAGYFADKNTNAAFLMMVTLTLIAKLLPKIQVNDHQLSKLSEPSQQAKSPLSFNTIALSSSIYLLSLAMFLVLSRGVVLSFALSLLLLIALSRRHISMRRLSALLLILGASLLTVVIFAQPALAHRMDLLQHEKSRHVIWLGAWHLWQATPWYGLGIFNFLHHFPAFILPGDGSSLQYAHNDFLQLLIETGLPGIVILLGLMGVLVLSLMRYLRNPLTDPVKHLELIGCFAALFAFVANCLVNASFYILVMNLLLGCYLGYLHYELKKTKAFKLWAIKPSILQTKMLTISMYVMLATVSYIGWQFLSVEFYVKQAANFENKQNFYESFKATEKAAAYFDSSALNLRQVAIVMHWVNASSLTAAEKQQLCLLAKQKIKHVLRKNPDQGNAYLQLAVIDTFYLNKESDGLEEFNLALKNNPQLCRARLILVPLLIKKGLVMQAKDILEQGLNYPIPRDLAEPYLTLLAQVDNKTNHPKAANRVMSRLHQLVSYETDYSDLLKG